MPITTFDTLKYVRRLEQAGMPAEQAEVQAEVLSEAFNVNLESLVTRDYLAAQFAGQKAYVDTRFAEQQAVMDKRFAEQQTASDKRFADQLAYMDGRFERLEAKVDNNARFFSWTQAIIIAAVLLPYFERLLAL